MWTRSGSLVVERLPLNRRDPGSIPGAIIRWYEFYYLVGNVFALFKILLCGKDDFLQIIDMNIWRFNVYALSTYDVV